MINTLKSKSKTPLQFKVFHTLLGLAIFFSLITLPAECQIIKIFGLTMSSELLWWPIVFYIFYVINKIYGFAYLRHAVYLVILFRIIYILFLKIAIYLPSSSFWTIQKTYSHVLGRDFSYTLKISILIWCASLLPTKLFYKSKNNFVDLFLFIFSTIIFSYINLYFLHKNIKFIYDLSIFPVFSICLFLIIFSKKITNYINKIESVVTINNINYDLFKFTLPLIYNHKNIFKYHHILFCSSIVFFIASKTMASKFITIGFFTINVGGIVFSLSYLDSDIMTDVYGIERTKQMILFVIFLNLLFVIDIWITNSLAINENGEFKIILHNQTRMFFSSGIAFFLGMSINSIVISIIKSKQRRRGISLKKEFITTVWTRVATSSAFGIIIDVSLFSFVAFYGLVPSEKLSKIIFFEDIYKISYEIVLAPISVLLIYFLKTREKIDIYDEISNLNPFRIDTNYKMEANKFKENYIKSKKEK